MTIVWAKLVDFFDILGEFMDDTEECTANLNFNTEILKKNTYIFILMFRSIVKAQDIKILQHDRDIHQQLSRSCVYACTSGVRVTRDNM